MLVYERLLTGLRSYAAARLLTQLVSLAGTVYLIRTLDSHAFGLFGIAVVAFNYFSMIYDGTLTETLVQRYPATPLERRAVFSLMLALGALTTVLMVMLAKPLALLVNEPEAAELIAVLACGLMLTALTVMPHARLLSDMAFPRLAIISGVQALVTTAASIGLAYSGAGPWSLVLGMLIGLIVRVVALNVVAPSVLLPTFAVREAYGYLRFGGILLADNILWRWYVSLDTLLLGRWAGTAALGYYNVAQQVAELPLEKISTIANDVALPAYTELSADRRAFTSLMIETMRTHAAVGFPIFWGIASVAAVAVPVLFGAKWDASVFPLMALAAIAPLRLIGSVETPAMTGLGRPDVLLRTKLIVAPCMTVALLAGVRFGGINGAALAWLLAFPVCYAVAFRLVLRAAHVPYADVLRVLRGPAIAAAAMAVVVCAWQAFASSLTPVALLASAIAVGALTYAVILRLADPEAFQLVLNRIARLIGVRQAQ